MSKRAEIHIKKSRVSGDAADGQHRVASAETLTGTVVGVSDGDTIKVLDANHEQHKIRLTGIDAPEAFALPGGWKAYFGVTEMLSPLRDLDK